MYSTIIFDLDGTLLDTINDLANAGNYALDMLGLPTHSVNEYKQMVGHGIPMLVRRILGEYKNNDTLYLQAQTIFHDYYSLHMNDITVPYPGIPALLGRLKNKRVGMAILSNKADHLVAPIVDKFFPNIFDMVLGHQEKFLPKPDPASTQFLIESLQANPSSTLFCGDSDVDVLTARNAGLTCCAVLWGFRTKRALEDAGAEHFASTVEELETFILL